MAQPLFLIGFMAAGKSSVGQALAAATGRRFVDLDDVIAGALPAGDSVAALVGRDEPAFRRHEAAALAQVIASARATSGDALVVATGGGAAAFGENLAQMRAAGLVIALGVDTAEAAERARGNTSVVRPLLAQAATLAAQRAPVYRRAHAVVETSGRTISEVVAEVRAVEEAAARVPAGTAATWLALGERTYPITVDDGPPTAALAQVLLGAVSRLAVITDAHVATHWLPALLGSLGGLPVEVVTIAPGEASKSFAVYERVCGDLIARGLDRGSAILALGGGVVGDLAGFVAATLFRGIPVVQLPTTIVAMTDAAIGGKTAVDLPAGKNLVGAFWQPRLVACHLATLGTLPARERRAGFGELWKYALLDGPDLWRAVAACAPWAASPVLDGAVPAALRDVIARAIAYKAAIVSRDERERTGHRALLNLGHTIGHAIEAASLVPGAPGGPLLHGEAVGLGLVAACRVSAAVRGAPASNLEAELVAALVATGLPSRLEPYLTDEVLGRITVDKKRIGANLRFVVVREVGACEPCEIAVTEVRRILRSVPPA